VKIDREFLNGEQLEPQTFRAREDKRETVLNTLSAVRGLLLMLGESEITHPWWTYAGELCSRRQKPGSARILNWRPNSCVDTVETFFPYFLMSEQYRSINRIGGRADMHPGVASSASVVNEP